MPYVSAVEKYLSQKRTPFHMPGHKQGVGINPKLKKLWGKRVFRYDLTEVDGLDYLNAPTGIIAEAEKLAAYAFGAKATFFLVNGSTLGNEAAILSLVKEKEKILVSRNAHQSTSAGIILSGAIPIYAKPTLHEKSGLYPAISSQEIASLLELHPDIKAVHITSPTYIGFTSHIKDIKTLTKTRNIPLIVDEAHGSHFIFHPELPKSAITYGADVVIQSIHKTLGALTQSSMLHLVEERYISSAQLQNTIRLLQSSSPNTILIMGLDAARQQIATQGFALLSETLRLARTARKKINNINKYYCYGKEVMGSNDIAEVDETKLLINVSRTGYTGYEIEKILGKKYGIEIEMSDTNHILCLVTIGDTETSINSLIKALTVVAHLSKGIPQVINRNLSLPKIPELILTPREAFFASKRRVSLSQSLGQVSGEFIVPFPPDVPIIVPGEKINEEILEYVNYLKSNDTIIIGPQDTSLKDIFVIK
jgi:arginine decarboxylase